MMNYFMAFLAYPILLLVVMYVCPLVAGTYMEMFLYDFMRGIYSCSLSFCIFNLLPFYPLDGFRIVDALNKKRGKIFQFLRQYGYYILLGLILLHFLSSRMPYLAYIDVLGYVFNFAIKIFGKPISLFWNWIFGLIL